MTFTQLRPVLVVFLLLRVHFSLTQDFSLVCHYTCADPVTIWYSRCGTCLFSKCKYEGCLYTGHLKSYWKPKPCMKCFCENGKKKCYRIKCNEGKSCYGYPRVKRPGECCSECDFGDSRHACSVIPAYTLRYNPIDPKSTCSKLIKHKCNYRFINTNKGKWYECIKEVNYRQFSDNPGCSSLSGSYEDVTKCVPHEIHKHSIPKDYEPHQICRRIPSGITCHQNVIYIILILLLVNCL